jgi:hypothetical protein
MVNDLTASRRVRFRLISRVEKNREVATLAERLELTGGESFQFIVQKFDRLPSLPVAINLIKAIQKPDLIFVKSSSLYHLIPQFRLKF